MKKRRLLIAAVLILAIALAFRLAYYSEYRSQPEFEHPTVDALYHHLSATAISGGALVGAEPFFRAPLYNYFLGLVYYFAQDDIASARLIQLILGAFTPLLLFLLCLRLSDWKVALIAAVLALLCGDLVYFEGELLLESLLVTLFLLIFLCISRVQKGSSLIWIVLCGLLSGVAIITRPNTAVLALLAGWLVFILPGDKRWAGLKRLGFFLALLLLPILAVLWHNVTREHPAFTIATQGGINFYLGNNSAADGVSAVMPGKLGRNWQYEDIAYLAEQNEGRKLSPSEISSYYYRKGLGDVIHDPVHWLGLALKKIFIYFSGFDISNNRNLTAFKSRFAILKILPVGMWLLAPLGLVGIVLAWPKSGIYRLAALTVILYTLTFALFFVNSRFRLPVLPLLSMLSAFTLLQLLEFVRKRAYLTAALVAGSVLILTILLNSNIYHLDLSEREQATFSKGNLDLRLGDNHNAVTEFKSILADGRPLPQTCLNLGVAYLRLGESDSAWKYFALEDSVSGGSAEALGNLSYLARQAGKPAEAVALARRALVYKPYLEDARLNLWYAWRELGFSDSAYSAIAHHARENTLSHREKFLLAVTAIDLGLQRAAITSLEEIIADTTSSRQPTYSDMSSRPSLLDERDNDAFLAKVYYNLGTAFGADRRIDSAVVYLRAAVDLDSTLAAGWANLGSAYFALTRYRDAAGSLQKAIDLGLESEVLHYNLALADLALADTASAAVSLRRCLELNPEMGQALSLMERLKKKTGGP